MNLCVQRFVTSLIFKCLLSTYCSVSSLFMFDGVFVQVEEAVAVLQAHQAKKDATQKVGTMATSAAAATS